MEVWEANGEKNSGPDGFNLKFIHECWDFLEQDIMKFVAEFHKISILPKAITSSFLAFILILLDLLSGLFIQDHF